MRSGAKNRRFEFARALHNERHNNREATVFPNPNRFVALWRYLLSITSPGYTCVVPAYRTSDSINVFNAALVLAPELTVASNGPCGVPVGHMYLVQGYVIGAESL